MNLNNFEEHISPEIIDRGYDYFVSECVDGLEKVASGMWLAEVHGSEIYTVEVDTHRTKIKNWDCECPYEYGPICKHVVAVIYAIAEEMESDKKRKPNSKGKKQDKNKVQQIAAKVSKEELWQFVLTLFKSDRSLKNRFIAHFAELLDEDLSIKYKTIVRNYYKAAQGQYGFIDYYSASTLTKPLYELAEKASDLLAEDNKVESLAICKSLIEEVSGFIHNMDDSDSGVDDVLEHAFETFDLIVASAPPMLKDELFDYCIGEFPKQKYRDFGLEDSFLILISDLVSSEEQESKFMELIDRQIETEKENPYLGFQITRLINVKVDYLLNRDREEDALALIEKHKHLPVFREMLVDLAVSKEDFDKAKTLCHDGIRIAEKERLYGNTPKWHVRLQAIAKLEGNVHDQRKWAKKLFFENYYSMEWYSELKSTWTEEEWPEQCEELIAKIKGEHQRGWHGEAEALANIFIEENYLDRLLKHLQLNPGNIDFVDRYAAKLTRKYPEEVLELYEGGVKESIKQTGRKVYRRVAGDLRTMKKIKGGDERAYALLKQFLRVYNNRPAMKEEFQKVFPAWVASNENEKKRKDDFNRNNNLSLF